MVEDVALSAFVKPIIEHRFGLAFSTRRLRIDASYGCMVILYAIPGDSMEATKPEEMNPMRAAEGK